ncbi:N-acetylmuramoyl-L-alanine amidase family protein [Winogradskyella sp. UBA3174]|uniref:N-acetylmuramoyl-L-alanine amidase family protein n=1 Tax=Winogradskyella sp. UBA3174 TaxID=1947785 RepID=UPI0025D5A3B0|nr:N-acetylmuramoyl-L-alanine amidase [Winogradskyella sp. UBA3174]|tara:strand:- start:34001 stop:35107 length:1107 start_codon:yes stop_codon:yes gene_type:complete
MQTYRKYIIVFLVVTFINSLTSQGGLEAQNDKFVVVLDAGHGGHDPGRPTKNGYIEKNIALKIVLQVGKALEKNPNYKVIYTRKTDVFVTLRNRAKIANKADADLFVSVHCNAHHTQAYGTETYVLGAKNSERNMAVAKAENEVIFLEDNYEEHYEGFDPSSPESSIAIGIEQEVYIEQSIQLARKIEDNFSGQLKRKSRGIKQLSLWVLHNTYMPSVLVETGFITNKNEGAYLNSKNGQTKIATALKDAIIAYKKEIDQNVGSSIIGLNPELEDIPLLYKDVTFKVQIAASSKDLAPKSYNFSGLSGITKDKVGKLYKYYYGVTSDYNKVKKMQEEAKSKGYSSSFVVAFKNGKRVPIDEALNTASN